MKFQEECLWYIYWTCTQSKLVLTFLPCKRIFFPPFDDKMQLLIIHNLTKFILRFFFHFNFRAKDEKIAFTVVYSGICDCNSIHFLTHTQSILKNRSYLLTLLKESVLPTSSCLKENSFPTTVLPMDSRLLCQG